MRSTVHVQYYIIIMCIIHVHVMSELSQHSRHDSKTVFLKIIIFFDELSDVHVHVITCQVYLVMNSLHVHTLASS